MSRNTSISLGTHFDRFVAEQVGEGRYASASEVIRAGLRLLETEETRLRHLQQLLQEGEESGAADYALDALIADLDQEATRE